MTSAKKAAGQRAATAKQNGAGRVATAKTGKVAAAKKSVAPAKKSAPAKKAASPASRAAAKKTAPAKKAQPTKKAASPKKTAPAKKAAPAKAASGVKKGAAAKKAAPAKKTAAATKSRTTEKPAAARTKGVPATKKSAARAPNPRPYAKDTKFLDEQRMLLEAERAVYQEQAAALKAEADSLAQEREPGDVQFDEESGEGGTVTVDRERDLALSAQALAAVEEIDDALSRIANGTYGVCERCRQPIPKPRLRALPYARLCVACKSGGLSRR